MHFLLRIMGFVAGLNQSMSRQSVNFIPVNWGLIGVCGLTTVIGTRSGVIEEHDPQWLYITVPCALVASLLLLSTLKCNTFFRGENDPPVPVALRTEAAILGLHFGFTGKLRLHEKEAQRFLDVPARAMRLESGALAWVSNIDASTRFSGVVTKSKVGLWLSVPRLDAPKIEPGTLYFGKKVRPALRVQFLEGADAKNRRATAILSFDVPLDRDAMRDWLGAQSATPDSPISASPFSSSTG